LSSNAKLLVAAHRRGIAMWARGLGRGGINLESSGAPPVRESPNPRLHLTANPRPFLVRQSRRSRLANTGVLLHVSSIESLVSPGAGPLHRVVAAARNLVARQQ